MPKYTNCLKCGNPVSKNCKLGFCGKCRNRSGENNPFFGKKHNPKTIQATKSKLSKIAKNLWQDPSYQNKVIKGVSKPRKSSFRAEQSKRMESWYSNNPEQIKLRSEAMKKAWKDGKIEPHINSINESKDERKLLAEIKNLFPDHNVRKSTIKIDDRWFYPDIRIDDDLIIEFYGDFWHGNPSKYKPNDILARNMTAKQIWQKDKERIEILRKNGFKIIVVWQSDYKNDHQKVIQKILSLDFH